MLVILKEVNGTLISMKKCIDCGILISNRAKRCASCSDKNRIKKAGDRIKRKREEEKHGWYIQTRGTTIN